MTKLINSTSPTYTMKDLPRKANCGSRKKFQSSALFSEQWRLTSREEVRKAQERMLGYKAQRGILTTTERTERCKKLVSAAITVLNSTESEPCPDLGQQTPDVPSAESLYGYNDVSSPRDVTAVNVSASKRRRYQRRNSVTEFSLQAAALARVADFADSL